jgi:hypothetical protein
MRKGTVKLTSPVFNGSRCVTTRHGVDLSRVFVDHSGAFIDHSRDFVPYSTGEIARVRCDTCNTGAPQSTLRCDLPGVPIS